MSRAPPLLAAALGLATACARAPAPVPAAASPAVAPPARYRVEDVPRDLQPALARADAAIRTLRERIAARLAAQIAAGGISGALDVCGPEARALGAAVSAQTGVEVGRTRARLRGGASPARAWAAPLVEEATARRAADVQAVVVDLGDRLGVLRPIGLTSACLSCHGPAERVAPDVKAAADGAYAAEGNAGFAEGDLRGFFWAEAPKRRQ